MDPSHTVLQNNVRNLKIKWETSLDTFRLLLGRHYSNLIRKVLTQEFNNLEKEKTFCLFMCI